MQAASLLDVLGGSDDGFILVKIRPGWTGNAWEILVDDALAPMVICPTSLFPDVLQGRPTEMPDA